MKNLPKKVVIIGAGVSGLFVARRLTQIAKVQSHQIEITFLEKNNYVGGKCKTYFDHVDGVNAEFGAISVASNYTLIIEAMKEYNLFFEELVGHNHTDDGLKMESEFYNLTVFQKIKYIFQLVRELRILNRDYALYKKCYSLKQPLPEIFQLSFSEYSLKRHIYRLYPLIRVLISGFGYGDLMHCPTYAVLEGLGYSTLFCLILGRKFCKAFNLVAIQSGFQKLMEKIAENFIVHLSVEIKSIRRSKAGVEVEYIHNNKLEKNQFDCLVLANSPINWPSLNMALTQTEISCVNNTDYYRYPVFICRIKGFKKNGLFIHSALQRNGFGHVALVSTKDHRDNPVNGRLCTVYINLPPKQIDVTIQEQWENVLKDLSRIEGVKDVSHIKGIIWEDYMSTLPWSLRLKLDNEQYLEDTKTIYVGPYILGGFELVSSLSNVAVNLINELFDPQESLVEKFNTSTIINVWRFLITLRNIHFKK